MENEDADPVGGPRADARAAFTELAVEHGLIRPGDKLDQNVVDFAMSIVELCASIGDDYGDDSCGGNAGERIRAEFFE